MVVSHFGFMKALSIFTVTTLFNRNHLPYLTNNLLKGEKSFDALDSRGELKLGQPHGGLYILHHTI